MEHQIPDDINCLLMCREKLTEEEKAVLYRWLEEHPECRREVELYEKLYDECRSLYALSSLDSAKALHEFERRTFRKGMWTGKRIWAAGIVSAAVIVVGFFVLERFTDRKPEVPSPDLAGIDGSAGTRNARLQLASGECIDLASAGRVEVRDREGRRIGVDSADVFVYQEKRQEEPAWNTLSVPLGGEYSLKLPDGTQVWVNAGSALIFPNMFSGRNREVRLVGEAYFEVAKDRDRPFIVSTRQSRIRVLGTSFNIMSYPEDDREQTTLVRGRVEVENRGRLYPMEPGRQLEVDRRSAAVEYRMVDVSYYTAWKEGMFRFYNMPLEELTVRLHRWYGVDFVFDEAECRKVRFSGAVRKYANLYRFMEMLEETAKVGFHVSGGKVHIRMK